MTTAPAHRFALVFFVYVAFVALADLVGCTKQQQRIAVTSVDPACELLELSEKVCAPLEVLTEIAKLLLAAKEAGKPVEIEVRGAKGSQVLTIPPEKIPGALAEVERAAASARAKR